MTRPLQPGDPTSFGPFTIDSRLADSPAGVVFLGADEEGRRAAIATLTGPAAEDPMMQQRFRMVADPAELYDAGQGVRVLAADLDGSRPWIATSYDGVQPGAERVFEELSSNDATARHFQPFTQYPADTGYLTTKRRSAGPPRRTWWWWLLVGIALLAPLLLLLGLFGPGGCTQMPEPTRSPTTGSTSGTSPQSPSQSQSPSPSSSGSSSGSRSPSTSGSPTTGSPSPTTGTGSGSPGTGTGEPTGAPLQLPKPTR